MADTEKAPQPQPQQQPQDQQVQPQQAKATKQKLVIGKYRYAILVFACSGIMLTKAHGITFSQSLMFTAVCVFKNMSYCIVL